MNTWSFYDLTTGQLAGASYGGPSEFLALNTPAGHAAVLGLFDARSQRVDLATGEVIDYQPPAPPDTELAVHNWDATMRRWIAAPTPKALRLRERARITAQIAQAEEATARPLRELLLDTTNTAARERLAEINAQIVALRASMPPIDLE